MTIVGSTFQLSIYEGTPLEVGATFTNELTGELVDPTVINAGYQIDDDTPVVTTYGAGPITRTSTGIYVWMIDTTGFVAPGNQSLLIILWEGTGALVASSPPYPVTILGRPFPLT